MKICLHHGVAVGLLLVAGFSGVRADDHTSSAPAAHGQQTSGELPRGRVTPVAVIDLPATRGPAAIARHKLSSGIHGEAIVVDPATEQLAAEPAADGAHVALKLKRGPFGNKLVDVGTLSLEQGTLFLQWADASGATAGQDLLRYAVVHTSGGDADPAAYTFVQPATISVVINQKVPTPTKLPPAVAPLVRSALTQPSEWKSSINPNKSLRIEQGGAALTVVYDPTLGNITVLADAPDPKNTQARLASRTAELNKATAILQQAMSQDALPPRLVKPARRANGMYYPAEYEDRTVLHNTISAAQRQIARLTPEIQGLQPQAAEAQKRTQILATAPDVGLSLLLPNGVNLADVKLAPAK